MAEAAQRFLEEHPDRKLVVLAGNGHIRYKYGIPERLYRRNKKPYTVILQDEDIEDGIADYVLRTTVLKGNTAPKLGMIVEEKARGLVVTEVRDKSPAKKAGLQKGDVIKRLEDQPIQSLADLKIALFYCERNSIRKIRFDRNDRTITKNIILE